MRYKVSGTVVFNVEMIVDASSPDEAEALAMDRMDDGSTDGFRIMSAVGDNEVTGIKLIGA